MTRRLKRLPEFDLALQLKKQEFLSPPREAQRNWLLNRAMGEFTRDIYALDEQARRFVVGSDQIDVRDRACVELDDSEIMEDWQFPIMQAMVDQVARPDLSILEIGYGRGVSSEMIQRASVGSHTIIECNQHIMASCRQWRAQFADRDIRLVQGMWQEVIDSLGAFDAIFFHTYPLQESDYVEQILESVTFAEHFFPFAARHLVNGGAFTYLSNEIDSLSRSHQRLLFEHFSRIELLLVKNLALPDDVADQWWADSMVVVRAVK